ncbi:MAG: AI-2E family transporter [Candidatus Liptonbacteria bacterium]|nr:AI-2E family transporter [Candidatus Liptonbacteria bacterium]
MNTRDLQIYFFLALLIGILALVFFIFLPYLSVFVLAATFAVIFQPLHQKILRLMRQNDGLAAFLSTMIVIIVILVPLFLFSFQLIQEARGLYTDLTTGKNTALPKEIAVLIKDRLQRFVPGISFNFDQYLRQILESLVQNFGSVFSTFSKFFINFVLSFFALYYFFKDGNSFKNSLISLSPLTDEHNRMIIKKLRVTVSSVIKGTLIVSLIQGALAGLGFFIFGLPNPALWGSVTVIAALLPAIGTALITIPAGFYLLLSGHLPQGIGMIAWGIAIVGTVDNFLRPKLIQRKIHIHPFFILLSVIGGIAFFGPIGFLIGPLVLSLLFALFDIYPTIVLKSESVQKI